MNENENEKQAGSRAFICCGCGNAASRNEIKAMVFGVEAALSCFSCRNCRSVGYDRHLLWAESAAVWRRISRTKRKSMIFDEIIRGCKRALEEALEFKTTRIGFSRSDFKRTDQPS